MGLRSPQRPELIVPAGPQERRWEYLVIGGLRLEPFRLRGVSRHVREYKEGFWLMNLDLLWNVV